MMIAMIVLLVKSAFMCPWIVPSNLYPFPCLPATEEEGRRGVQASPSGDQQATRGDGTLTISLN